jgi:hypothetical protein
MTRTLIVGLLGGNFSGLGCRELFDDRQVPVEDLVMRLYYWLCFASAVKKSWEKVGR